MIVILRPGKFCPHCGTRVERFYWLHVDHCPEADDAGYRDTASGLEALGRRYEEGYGLLPPMTRERLFGRRRVR